MEQHFAKRDVCRVPGGCLPLQLVDSKQTSESGKMDSVQSCSALDDMTSHGLCYALQERSFDQIFRRKHPGTHRRTSQLL